MKLYIVLLIAIVFRLLTFTDPYPEGKKVRVNGIVSREPVQYDNRVKIEVGNLGIYVPKYPEISYGDMVTVEGRVKGSLLENAKILKIEETRNVLYLFRERLISFYKSSLPEPHSSLVAGVTLGSKSTMPISFWEDLRNSGTAHVVVASGMNITLVGGFLLSTLVNFINRKKALVFVIVSIWLYALMAGFDAPIIRAAIMGTIAFMSQISGRVGNSLRALILSAGVMLVINPMWVKDVGYQLSVVATGSLIIFDRKVYRMISFVPNILRGDLSTTIAAQIGVAPILLYYFNSFNLLSPIVNAFVLWTIPLITIISMISGLIGLVFPWFGKVILFLVYPLSSWFVGVVNLLS